MRDSFLVYAQLSLRILSVFGHDQVPLLQPEHRGDEGPISSDIDVSLNIRINDGSRNDTAPYLSGLLFEDIAHSGDGGLYAELIRNRAFQGSGVQIGREKGQELPGVIIKESENPIIPFGPVLDGWYPIGDARLSLDLLHPLSDALQVALQVDIPLDATGEVGFKNDGWWGIHVSPQIYNASFFAQTNGFRWNGTLTHFDLSLRNNASDEIYVQSTISLNGTNAPVPWMYRNYTARLVPNVTAPSTKNAFAITMDAEEARGQTFYFDLISLFPETYKNRSNGLRKDLAEKLEAGNFKFLRFPGGNNLEGYSIARRWKWWETIGVLKDRPGRPGDWSYYNTDGLGLLEYMYWCEDMNLVPVLAVYAGFSLDVADYDSGNSTDSNELPIDMMEPVLQEVLDELEFLMGNTSTYWGAKRAEYGHPEPFEVPFVEIGNEDFFSHDYAARARFMLEGMKVQYPGITYIYSSDSRKLKFNITFPEGVIWDKHLYANAMAFINKFDEFDNWQEKNEGAYASIMEYHVNGIDRYVDWPVSDLGEYRRNRPRMLSAVSEAVYALGWEKNPNTVKLACFAPLMQNAHFWRHTPYLLLFDADPAKTITSTSYWQQQMFNLHQGAQTLPVTARKGDFGPLFWHASIEHGKIYLKVVNAGDTYQALDVQLDTGCAFVNGTTLHASEAQQDGIGQADNEIVPRPIHDLYTHMRQLEDSRTSLTWLVPPWSVNVLQFDVEEADLLSHEEQAIL